MEGRREEVDKIIIKGGIREKNRINKKISIIK